MPNKTPYVIAISVATYISFSEVSFSDENSGLKPLSDVIEMTNTNNATLRRNTFLYISNRCGGLYGLLTSKFTGSSDPRASKILDFYKAKEDLTLDFSLKVTEDGNYKITVNDIIALNEIYKEIADLSYLKTGSFMSDFIEADIKVCNSIFDFEQQ